MITRSGRSYIGTNACKPKELKNVRKNPQKSKRKIIGKSVSEKKKKVHGNQLMSAVQPEQKDDKQSSSTST